MNRTCYGSIAVLLSAVLSGCASAPTTPTHEVQNLGRADDQKPELGVIRTAATTHDYRYHIYGDPSVAPAQAFSDGQYLYLQLAPGQTPPLAYTRDGDIIEYEVHRAIMRLPKVDSVVLRMGPRRAYVDHKEVRIVPAQAPTQTEVDIEVKVNRVTHFTLRLDANPADVLSRTRGWRRAELCHAPIVAAHRAAQRYASVLRAAGVQVDVSAACADESVVQFRGEL